ncbi:tRNA (adenine22-N1)-methyltransferase [Bacillus thermophilus]|uniref:tRNA (Adenine22-N1)-methyltransferase n=1 Tax=Siminovitchia thermophila TaxID=1245522 RepID=A0ABS2RA97_9BACI|nr:tRNA (adenine(22)-N(1))-methyltransferase TrmK [Siminovitchia thermophila]MBM7716285.1 tRNA (adenine22-N1)-methyltransferase [Siminovitchia thermophila]ONK24220.1 SAM-dependent methyltransferase [Bacillus sp. VT-16-64]
MNEVQLSKRLQAVVANINHGMRIADIGSDHAYLPCHVIKRGIASFAIAGEIADGPFQSAQQQVEKSGVGHYVDVRKGDGLEVLQVGEVDCIIIAGMGGLLISRILEAGREKLAGVTRLILQPNIGAIHIRQWLMNNGWELVSEQILEDDGKIYEVLVAERGDSMKHYREVEKELLLGPFLLKEKSGPFRKKWLGELQRWKKIVENLEQSQSSADTLAKKEAFLRKIAIVEEALT